MNFTPLQRFNYYFQPWRRSLKYRFGRWLKRTFNPPRYFVATYGGMGLDVEFFTHVTAYEIAVAEAELQHGLDHLDSYTHGDVE